MCLLTLRRLRLLEEKGGKGLVKPRRDIQVPAAHRSPEVDRLINQLLSQINTSEILTFY